VQPHETVEKKAEQEQTQAVQQFLSQQIESQEKRVGEHTHLG